MFVILSLTKAWLSTRRISEHTNKIATCTGEKEKTKQSNQFVNHERRLGELW